MTACGRLDFGALLPHVHVFGGVRRFLEIGNVMVRRGHRYVLYHPDGTPPQWLQFHGEVRPLAALSAHQVLLTASTELLQPFAATPAQLKLFYCVHKNLPGRGVVRSRDWTLLANSEALRRRLRRRYGVRVEDAIGGVDIARFRPRPRPDDGEPPLRLLAYGRLSRPGKGTRVVVRAAEGLAGSLRRWPAWGGAVAHPVRLHLFDHDVPGEAVPPLRCGVPFEVHRDLPQEELARLYASCDVFVAAERRAGWSNTVAEAMASGAAVVCTRAGTQELAVHGATALVVPWRHPFFFRRALLRLARDAALRRRLGRAARQRAEQYSWERVAERIESVVRLRLQIR
jgi:glycosyltransferase involved in cell wall biosynthesis